ncbi:MAG: S1 RNA-binding domain-containing protein [Kiritimatiellia bacterium]|jgi:small subunit ribosomal protein S1
MIEPKRTRSASMAELMDEIDAQMATMRRGFDPGEKIVGTVLSVGAETIVVDINSQMQGLIDRSQWKEGELLPSEGDVIDVYFVEVRDGAARLSLGTGAATDQSIMQAFQAQLPIEGKIEKEVNGGYEVRVSGHRAFCPFSQVGLARKADAEESPIGQTLNFLVIEYDPDERTLVVSHRALLDRERAEKREALKAELHEGMVRDGVVTNIMPFGVFVDIGGVEGLIPLREISWDRTVKPEDILHIGQAIRVAILSLDWEADRFSFSLRDTVPDPWHDFAGALGPGSYVTGTVVKLMPFGAFVSLAPGVEGLVPVSRLGAGRRIGHPRGCVSEGDALDLQVETIDHGTKKMSLKVVDKRVRDMQPGLIAIGAQLKGLVEGIREFGVFVRLSEDKTGLLHIGECDIEKGGSPTAKLETKFPLGSMIDVVVKALDGERISLTLPSKAEAPQEDATDVAALMRAASENAQGASISSIGSMLDDLFKS